MSKQWPRSRFGEVALDLTEERTFWVKPDDIVVDPTITSAIHRISAASTNRGFEVKVTKRIRIEPGDLVFSRLHTQNGAFAFSEGSFQATGTFVPFRLNEAKVDRRFLFWALHQFVPTLAASDSVGRETYKTSDILGLEIPLPPLVEQQRIVTRIEELIDRIDQARVLRREAVERTNALFLSQIGQTFSKLEAQYGSRDFGSFSPHVTSGPRNWAKHYEKGGFRFYRAQDIGQEGKVVDTSKVFIAPPPGEQGRSALLQRGDLMLVITGATVGRVGLYREALEPGFVSQHVGICRLPRSEVEPEFVLWGLRGPNGRAQLLEQRYGQGKPGLNLSNIRSLTLPFPPLREQRKIVAELDRLQVEVAALKHLQTETATELDSMTPAVLDRAFRGQL